MKTGYAKFCINPPLGAPIVGYYEPRFVKGVADDLFARALAFYDGKKRAVVVTLDLCILPQSYYDTLKQAITDVIDIEKDAIFITCSHTHTGPLLGKDFASDATSPPEYDDILISGVQNAVKEAFSELSETTAEMALTEAKGISFIRRFRMKDGSVATNPGVGNKNIDHPLGEPNETVRFVKLVRKDSYDIVVVNFGTHSDTVGGEYISADYIGRLCAMIEKDIPNTRCIFLMGPQGDVNHINVNPSEDKKSMSNIDFDGVPRGLAHASYMGRTIADAVLSVYQKTTPIDIDEISFASKKVALPSHKENERLSEMEKIYELYRAGRANELPFKEMELTTVVAEATRIIKLKDAPDSFDYFLSAIKIGSLVLAGICGEPFTEIGNRIYENSPFDATILCALTNSAGEYIPSSRAYEEGGYEAKTSALAPGGDNIIVDSMTELLNSLKIKS